MTASAGVRRVAQGLVAVAVVAVVVALPATAGAATVTGTVVAKDVKRGTLATAGRGGAVTTLRTRAVRRYRVGQRVVASAAARGDGTYAASRIRSVGRAKRARVRGAVVRAARGGYLVSAGSSTFAISRRTRMAVAAAAASGPRPGDVVVADVKLADGALTAERLREVGTTGVLELEGIFLDVSDGRLRLAVEKRGLVEVEVPAGMAVTAKAGDEVELLVSIGAEGALTLVALKGEDDADDHGIDFDADDGEVEIEGLISELSATSLTVSAGPTASVTCVVPAGVSVVGFAVGDEVAMECKLVDGSFELRELESDGNEVEFEPEDRDDEDDD